ncbi:MAG: isoaspartyl peptidase/L-asparaginase [Thermofilaceae archaeon]
MPRPAIIIHGGAGRIREEDINNRLKFLREATTRGFEILTSGGSALNAVVEAVVVLEDSGVFNAGLGSCLTFDGSVEMDAGVMDCEGNIGAVAAVRRVKNPVLLAKKVMELTDHILMVSEGAERLASTLGLTIPEELIITSEKLRRLEELKARWLKGEDFTWLQKLRILSQEYSVFFETVGAAAVDTDGHVAAATSTGGYWLKLKGRVGDSPIPGAGFYALKSVGACSATGIGEAIIKSMLCLNVCEYMRTGLNAKEATLRAIEYMSTTLGQGLAGVIAVDTNGCIGYEFNTEAMLVGFKYKSMQEAEALLARKP